MDILEKVAQIIADELTCDIEDITPETHLADDLGADSLDAIELIMSIEDEFDVEIEDDDLQSVQTVQDIIDILENNL